MIAEKKVYNEQVLFWYVVKKVNKDTGEEQQEYKFDHDGLTFFLANNGFRKIKLGDKGYQFAHLSGNMIEVVEPEDITDFIGKYLHQYVKPNELGIYDEASVNDPLKEPRKMYKRGINTYSKTTAYTQLMNMQPQFLKDTEKTSFLFFENCYVKITADSITVKKYNDLNAHIWSKQKKNHHFTLLDEEETNKCVAKNFLKLCMCGESKDEKDLQKIQSIFSTIGYLITGYKDPTKTKAPIFQDKKINNSGTDANGGTGKTLTAKIISRMVPTCILDGKTFSFDSAYPYDLYKPDHRLIVYNDAKKNFQFERLFHKITEDFQYDKRYVDAILIPFEDAPKHLIITNYSVMGEGSSFQRRQQIIEFTDFFNNEYTPKEHFGHRFFEDWDNQEWNRFYNFTAECIQLYIREGLIPFPAENVKYNKLIQSAGEAFIDWMELKFKGDEKTPPVYALGQKLNRDDLFNALRNEVKQYYKMENSNTFTHWVKMWAEMMGYEINAHKNGGKDKSGANYYWTFTPKEK